MQYTMPRTHANVTKKLTDARNNRRRGRSGMRSRTTLPTRVRFTSASRSAATPKITARKIHASFAIIENSTRSSRELYHKERAPRKVTAMRLSLCREHLQEAIYAFAKF